MRVPDTLTVVLMNTHRTYIAIVHENEHFPFQRRTVQIKLTDEQRKALEPRLVGRTGKEAIHEEIEKCWLEPAPEGSDGEAT